MTEPSLMHHEHAATAGHRNQQVWRGGAHSAARADSDDVALELPVALEFNGISHATLLATPANLEDLAYGFCQTEGIVRSARDIYDVNVVERPGGLVIQVKIASACLHELKLRRRSLAGRTGCGLCGIESLDEVRIDLPALTPRPHAFPAESISHAVEQLRARQPLHLATGATHAAAWAGMDGNIGDVREDVGRHNALDKLIGHLLRESCNFSQGFAIVSSRASFEMVQKTAAAGISALVAVSAPTSYAIDVANELNVLLACFARQDRYTIYAHPEYVAGPGSPI